MTFPFVALHFQDSNRRWCCVKQLSLAFPPTASLLSLWKLGVWRALSATVLSSPSEPDDKVYSTWLQRTGTAWTGKEMIRYLETPETPETSEVYQNMALQLQTPNPLVTEAHDNDQLAHSTHSSHYDQSSVCTGNARVPNLYLKLLLHNAVIWGLFGVCWSLQMDSFTRSEQLSQSRCSKCPQDPRDSFEPKQNRPCSRLRPNADEHLISSLGDVKSSSGILVPYRRQQDMQDESFVLHARITSTDHSCCY